MGNEFWYLPSHYQVVLDQDQLQQQQQPEDPQQQQRQQGERQLQLKLPLDQTSKPLKLMTILVILIVQNLLWLKLEKIITIIITTMMMTKRKLNCFKKNLNFDAISHKKIHISKVHFIHCWSDFYKQLFYYSSEF